MSIFLRLILISGDLVDIGFKYSIYKVALSLRHMKQTGCLGFLICVLLDQIS